ncbi:MAG TPA: DUF4097 family beta strand repeat-containing protein, partial [Gemmatimonadaceae bacterium]
MTVDDLPRRRRRTALPPIFVAFCWLAASAGHAGAQQRTRLRSERERIDTTFAFDKNGSVTLTATSGDIIVGGSADARIHVVATSESGNLSLDASPNRVILQNRAGESRFEITVPYGVQIIARSQSGDMRIRDTRGPIEAHASSGDLEVEGVNGHLDVNTLSGGITARDVAGDADIATTSGDVRIFNLLGNA